MNKRSKWHRRGGEEVEGRREERGEDSYGGVRVRGWQAGMTLITRSLITL